MGGLDGGLEETVSRELGKVSLKTMPCLRAPPGVLACDFGVGVDLGGELGGDIEPKARAPTGVGRAEPVLLMVEEEEAEAEAEELLFVRKPSCAPYWVGWSGVTALMVA